MTPQPNPHSEPQASEPQPMTAERLAEIRARCEAATGGDYDVFSPPDLVTENGAVVRARYKKGYVQEGEIRLTSFIALCTSGGVDNRANAAFFAAAHTDVPDLLTFIEQLQARAQAAEQRVEELQGELQKALIAMQVAQRRFSWQNGEVSTEVWRDNYPATRALADAIKSVEAALAATPAATPGQRIESEQGEGE